MARSMDKALVGRGKNLMGLSARVAGVKKKSVTIAERGAGKHRTIGYYRYDTSKTGRLLWRDEKNDTLKAVPGRLYDVSGVRTITRRNGKQVYVVRRYGGML